MVVLASGLALTMAPATESIMGSLPLAKAGVGSAVNDTTRQVGGALGVAVLGSVFTSIYSSQLVSALNGQSIPADVVEAAKDSIGERDAGGGHARRQCRRRGHGGGERGVHRRLPRRAAGRLGRHVHRHHHHRALPARTGPDDGRPRPGDEFVEEHPELQPDPVTQ